MPNPHFVDFLHHIESPLTMEDFIDILGASKNVCIYVKNNKSNYLFANENFLQLMGLDHVNQLKRLSDYDLSKNKHDADKYRELDDYALNKGCPLSVSEAVSPAYNSPIVKTMEGKLYPLFSSKTRAQYIMGVMKPETNLLRLDWDTIFTLQPNEIDALLVKRSYLIKLNLDQIVLTKMEIKTLIELLKGGHAGNIALKLNIKQTTVESYLATIKNKLGVNHKSDLIHLIQSSKLLQQVII